MSEIKNKYAGSGSIPITLASLATDANLLTGRESTEFDNTSNLFLDVGLSGIITVGTTPTTNKEIRIYVAAIINDTPTWPDVLDGTDSAETLTNAEVRDSGLVLAHVIPVVSTTSNISYPFSFKSVAALFGGLLPKKFVIFVTHNTGVNLNSTGSNHMINWYGFTETVT